jgi:hypothetical protein
MGVGLTPPLTDRLATNAVASGWIRANQHGYPKARLWLQWHLVVAT